ncbi:MAG: hypothetical protein ACRDZ8_14445 [Acidimicrobiales bacterium]
MLLQLFRLSDLAPAQQVHQWFNLVKRRYEQRYLPLHRLYEQQHHPRELAMLVIDNGDPNRPVVVSDRSSSGDGTRPTRHDAEFPNRGST